MKRLVGMALLGSALLYGCGGGGGETYTSAPMVKTSGVDGKWKLGADQSSTALYDNFHLLPVLQFGNGQMTVTDPPLEIATDKPTVPGSASLPLIWTGTFTASPDTLSYTITSYNGNNASDSYNYAYAVSGDTLTLTNNSKTPPATVTFYKQ